LTPAKVAVSLGLITVSLVAANLFGLFMKYFLNHDYVYGLIPLFDLDREQNIPTLFSTSLLLISCALLAIIWHIQREAHRIHLPWLFLAAIFCFLAVDEFTALHEHLAEPVRITLGGSWVPPWALPYGWFIPYVWVIPYGLAVLFLSVVYARLIWNLKSKIRVLFLLSAATYVVGALGFELLGAWWYETKSGEEDFVYSLIYTGEETLEMVGLVLFIYSLMVFIQLDHQGLLVEMPSLLLESGHEASGPGRT
jgi:hypothetical protein